MAIDNTRFSSLAFQPTHLSPPPPPPPLPPHIAFCSRSPSNYHRWNICESSCFGQYLMPRAGRLRHADLGSLSEVWAAGVMVGGPATRRKWSVMIASGEAVGEASMTRKPILNEYMVTLERPIGLRFVQTSNGQVYVQALAKQGNAANSGMILVGDVLKKTSAETGNGLLDVYDLNKTMDAIKSRLGSVSLILERPSTPIFLGLGSYNANEEFSNKAVPPRGEWETTEIISIQSDEQPGVEVEWTHGNFPLKEYSDAISRAANDLCYNHKLGMAFTKITEHVYVGSCLQDSLDIDKLKTQGIGAILNLQTPSEQVNWEIDGEAIKGAATEKGLLIVTCPIRDVDTVDLRRKLPFAVGILYRLLRKGYRVYVSCTTGLNRAPACVIGYLHWLQDVAFEEAVDFVTNMHPCGPDRPALVWATWDLIAMAEKANHKGPPTHVVQFVWNHGCREGEDVLLVGDFKGGWDEPIRASHVSAQKYVVDLRLPQGKYHYKFIVGGHWQHSKSLPTEVDKWGNINNVIKIGDVASTKFDTPLRHPAKDLISIRVIERPLTEDERFTLAFAARRIAFGICPIRFTAKL